MGAFPCQCRFLVCVGRVFGNHLLWVLVAARAGPARAGGVFALRRSVPERPAGERLSVSRLLRPFTRARPRFGLCVASGGHVPVGASGWQEKWAVNKAGSRQVRHAQQMTDPCAARRLLQLMTVGASAWERPPGPQQVPVGAVPAALLLFPRGGSSPTPSGSPRGGCPSLGRCRGRRESGAPLWGAGLPLPPSSTAKI